MYFHRKYIGTMSAETLSRQRALKLEELRIIGNEKGWKLVTQIYGGSKTNVEFLCDKGHTFSLLSKHVNRNKCSICTGMGPGVAANKFYNIVAEKGGHVNPHSYNGSNNKVEITCHEGHKWNGTPYQLNNGVWCAECEGRSYKGARKYNAILQRRGALAADPYVTSTGTVRIQCKRSHIWTTTPSSINTDKHWCPVCADRSPIAAAESYYQAVKEREGIPLDKYINRETKLKIQCKKNHIFLGRPDHIKSGRWCPTCNESKGELMVANILTELGLPFEKQPRLPELARCPYDFLTYYNGSHVFVEFDGKQHFKQAPYHTEEEFKAGQQRDIEKTKLVIEKYKLRMIRIGYRALELKWDIKELLIQALNMHNPITIFYIVMMNHSIAGLHHT